MSNFKLKEAKCLLSVSKWELMVGSSLSTLCLVQSNFDILSRYGIKGQTTDHCTACQHSLQAPEGLKLLQQWQLQPTPGKGL